MLKIIKGAQVYSPEKIGNMDILLIGDKIGRIAENIEVPSKNFMEVEVIDAKGKIMTPGFIDGHVHIAGGGGEGGPATRTPEAMLTGITRFGETTVVGCLGTDGTTRNMAGLLAKARALEKEGITTYIYTGSYQIPTRVITDSPRNDIMLIDKVIGIGEIAISDHRSSQPVVRDLLRLASEARVGGLLSGKAGVLHLHVGDGKEKLDYLFEIIDGGEIPPSQMVPTHINRNRDLFLQAIEYAKIGGTVDITSSIFPGREGGPEIKGSSALKAMLGEGVPETNITMSSDGFGSSPVFDKYGALIKVGIGSVSSNHKEFCDSVLKEKIPISTALKPLTSNVADILKLSSKGRIKEGLDADLLLLNADDLSIDTVIAKGKVMVSHGKPIVFGTFEDEKE
ncbi:MAG TPA: beta-aspartyl-peptidase [Clostridiaceae bacterium]|nr:beta-aspartyl-peptidase [Clostridiaceae bacterium]